jgi:eukaryotic-like serine/threonine-protein kinase
MRPDALFAGRYRLERRLGVGGMATVQLAFDTRLERHVAVKLLAEHLAEDSNFVSRFRREALAAARLVHPNIVQVFDFGLDDGTHRNFIVMEYVTGQSCAEILREQGTLPPNEAVDILTQACRGLDYAHRNGVVHRDVKPGNLMRSEEGMVKLADFGIAKAAEDSDMTKVGSVLGTAAYLSPEQARGEPAGPSSDLYALGVVAYQLLAGRLPYDAGSLTDLARLQESGPPPRLDELEPAVPAALAGAVARALHRDPEHRYADAAEMETALRDGLRGRGPAETDATWALGDDETAATRMLTGSGTGATSALPRTSSQTPPRRRLEPLDEPPPPARRAQPRRPSAPPPKRRNGLRAFVTLLVVLALAGAGFAAYTAIENSGSSQGVQLREDVDGNVDQAIEQLRGLIEDNSQ